jgi:hypothetical protein
LSRQFRIASYLSPEKCTKVPNNTGLKIV